MSDDYRWPGDNKTAAERVTESFLGSRIAAEAFAHYDAWERKWADDLEEVEDIIERVLVYRYMGDGIDIDLAKAMARNTCNVAAPPRT